jgi:hypothetical protein
MLCSKMYKAAASASCGVNDRNDAGNGRFRMSSSFSICNL